jgi:hypothetical protein
MAAVAARLAREAEVRESKRAASPVVNPAPAGPAPPAAPSDSALRTIRAQRNSLLHARRALEEKLCLISWVEFRKQAQAIEFMRSQLVAARAEHGDHADLDSSALRLFAYEMESHGGHAGARRFIVTSYDDFWVRYFTFHASRRHHYELIREGQPCHLYFDIEFKYAANPQFRQSTHEGSMKSDGVNVEEVMHALCEEIVEQLNHRFTFDPPVTTKQILQLDSTSSVKFSRHLIVRLNQRSVVASAAATPAKTSKASASAPSPPPPPTFMFRDNAHAGRFVRALCQDITRQVRQSEAAESNALTERSVEPINAADAKRCRERRRRRLLRWVLIQEGDASKMAEIQQFDAASSTSAVSVWPSSHQSLMIDQSVYTRNRSFRLFLSSKHTSPFPSLNGGGELESAPVLLVAERNEYPLVGVELKEIFLSSLVCHVSAHVQQQASTDRLIARRLRTDSLDPAAAAAVSAQIPCPLADLQLLTFNELDECGQVAASTVLTSDLPSSFASTAAAASASNINGKRVRAASYTAGCSSSASRRFHSGPSPFPRLERFLLGHLKRICGDGGLDVRISGWTYLKDTESKSDSDDSGPVSGGPVSCGVSRQRMLVTRHSVTFNLASYRYCGNIGRSHRSNGVYFVFDLIGRSAHQRCWDVDCRYYRSPHIELPNWIADLEIEDMMAREVEEGDDDDGDTDREAQQRPAEDAALECAMNRAEQRRRSQPSSIAAAAVASNTTPAAPSAASSSASSLFTDDEDFDFAAFDALEASALAQIGR